MVMAVVAVVVALVFPPVIVNRLAAIAAVAVVHLVGTGAWYEVQYFDSNTIAIIIPNYTKVDFEN